MVIQIGAIPRGLEGINLVENRRERPPCISTGNVRELIGSRENTRRRPEL